MVVTSLVMPFWPLVQLKLLISYHRTLPTGELYTWGRDEGDGRLGLGSGGGPGEAGSLSVPSKVNALPVPVAAVACGGFFTLALTSDGQLWSWGG
jgi:alpha-tubulin suppressor-like RCC1 family protein